MAKNTRARPPVIGWAHTDSIADRGGLLQSKTTKPSLGITRAERMADQVYRRLRRSILHGELASGARLRETEIAESLAVSRTPVREAISRLIGDRLVHELLAGGVEVVDTQAEMEEIYTIREALEACAVGLAAVRIDEKQLEHMERLVEAAESTSYRQHSRRAALNQAFHLAIAKAARSPRLAALIANFREYFLNPSWLSRQTEDGARKALEDHRAIIEALRRGDRDMAEAALRMHLGRSYSGMALGHEAEPQVETMGARREERRRRKTTSA